MVKMKAEYQGQMHCELTHGPSGSKIETDAPEDNMGKGERFSPTDLVGAALSSCCLTIMAMVAERDGIEFGGAKADVEKHMLDNPRRIGTIVLKIAMPAKLNEKERAKLERAALTCPVHKSLHPDMKIDMTFSYTL